MISLFSSTADCALGVLKDELVFRRIGLVLD